MNILTVFIIDKIINPEDKKLFYLLVSSLIFLQIGGIMAVPDSPLVFFSVLFYFYLKKYLLNDNVKNTLALSVCMALLLYSKYHGILIIAFSMVGNLKCIAQKRFWLMLGLTALLFSPHLIWQFNHEFPSVKYHLVERNSSEYQVSNTLKYLLTQPLVYGPFIGVWLFYSLFKFKPANTFEKIIRNNALATFAFFLLMTFKGPVEGNWTIITLFPLIFMGYKQALFNVKVKQMMYKLYPVTLIIILTCRIFLVWNFLPKGYQIVTEFHNSAKWANQIKHFAGSYPVAFMNSYQKAAKYAFYSGCKSFSLNNAMGRKNQYNLWDSEFEFQGKTIFLIPNYKINDGTFIHTCKGDFQLVQIENFRTCGNIFLQSPVQNLTVKKNKEVFIPYKIHRLNNNIRDLEANKDYPTYLCFMLFKNKKKVFEKITEVKLLNSMLQNGKDYNLNVNFPIESGNYDLLLGTVTGWLPSIAQSNTIKLKVEE